MQRVEYIVALTAAYFSVGSLKLFRRDAEHGQAVLALGKHVAEYFLSLL